MMAQKMSKEDFGRIHQKFDEYHDDILILKKEMLDMKNSVTHIESGINELNKKLFIGNGHKSIISRLEGIENKLYIVWTGLGALGLMAAKFLFDLIVAE